MSRGMDVRGADSNDMDAQRKGAFDILNLLGKLGTNDSSGKKITDDYLLEKLKELHPSFSLVKDEVSKVFSSFLVLVGGSNTAKIKAFINLKLEEAELKRGQEFLQLYAMRGTLDHTANVLVTDQFILDKLRAMHTQEVFKRIYDDLVRCVPKEQARDIRDDLKHMQDVLSGSLQPVVSARPGSVFKPTSAILPPAPASRNRSGSTASRTSTTSTSKSGALAQPAITRAESRKILPKTPVKSGALPPPDLTPPKDTRDTKSLGDFNVATAEESLVPAFAPITPVPPTVQQPVLDAEKLLNTFFNGELLFFGNGFDGFKKTEDVTFANELRQRDDAGRATYAKFLQKIIAGEDCDTLLVKTSELVLREQGTLALFFVAIQRQDVAFVRYCLEHQGVNPHAGIAIAEKGSAQTWFCPAIAFAFVSGCNDDMMKLLLTKADPNARIKRIFTVGNELELVDLPTENPLSDSLLNQVIDSDKWQTKALLVDRLLRKRANVTAEEADYVLLKMIDHLFEAVVDCFDGETFEDRKCVIESVLLHVKNINKLDAAFDAIDTKLTQRKESGNSVTEKMESAFSDVKGLIACRIAFDLGEHELSMEHNQGFYFALTRKASPEKNTPPPSSLLRVASSERRKKPAVIDVPSPAVTVEVAPAAETPSLRDQINFTLNQVGDNNEERAAERFTFTSDNLVGKYTALAQMKKSELALLAKLALKPKELVGDGGETVKGRLMRHGATITTKLLSAKNVFQNKAVNQQRSAFYQPVFDTLQFFDNYLLQHIHGKKIHAPKRVQYCLTFFADDLDVTYNLPTMDKPIINVLTGLYKLKGLLMCEIHDAALAGDSYLSILFSSKMTGALASFVTNQISKLESVLDNTHKDIARRRETRNAVDGDVAIILSNIGSDIKGDIKDDDREDVKALKQARNEIAPLEKLYDGVGNRVRSLLFKQKPKMSEEESCNLGKIYSEWHDLIRPVC